MSETAGAAETARLDELAAVTKEYAAYAADRGGLASAAAGAWFAAVFAIALRSENWGRVAGLWTAFLVLAALAAARRRYQRIGAVAAPPGHRIRIWMVALLMAVVVMDVIVKSHAWNDGDPFAKAAIQFAAGTAPLVPLMFQRIAAGRTGGVGLAATAMTFLVASIGGDRNRVGWTLTLAILGFIAAFGVILVGLGISEHRKYRTLERRLAGLRGDP
jgi:hypothetical protein